MVAKQILDSISLDEFKYKYVIVQKGYYKDRLYRVEDLIKNFDRSFNIESDCRAVSINYQIRSSKEDLPLENDHLVYGKVQKRLFNGEIVELGEILHLSELLNENNELVKFIDEDIDKEKVTDEKVKQDRNRYSISSLIFKLMSKTGSF